MGKAKQRFETVTELLRARIRRGELLPGSHIGAVEIAEELKLSDTPVRQVLALLSGWGLLEGRSGEGYFVHRLDAETLSDLYQANAMLMSAALRLRRGAAPLGGEAMAAFHAMASEEDDRYRQLADFQERLLRRLCRDSGSRQLLDMFDRTSDRLAAARLAEAQLFDDIEAELRNLAQLVDEGSHVELSRRLIEFHRRRRARAAEIVQVLLKAGEPGDPL